jgi:hypothetical protein
MIKNILIVHYKEFKIITESVAMSLYWLLAEGVLLRATPAATPDLHFEVISERPVVHTWRSWHEQASNSRLPDHEAEFYHGATATGQLTKKIGPEWKFEQQFYKM